MARPVAVITGASRGIGRAIALRLAHEFEVAAVARSREALDVLADEIRADGGGGCRVVALDITDRAAVEGALAGLDAQVLVNNAGIGIVKPFVEMTADEWRTMVAVNLTAMADVTRVLLPGMLARGSGHIINIGSISGRSAYIGGSGYAATKHAVQGFSECLMLEVRGAGVKVSVINPGAVDTGFSPGGAGKGAWKLAAEDVANAVAAVIATPPDVLIYQAEVRTLHPPPPK